MDPTLKAASQFEYVAEYKEFIALHRLHTWCFLSLQIALVSIPKLEIRQ